MTQPVHTFCWVDIPVLNLDRAIAFYSMIFHSPVQKITEHGFEFGLLPHANNNISGCLSIMDNRKPSKDGPLVYLDLDDRIDRALEAVEAAGGSIVLPKMQIGPFGYRALIADTEGNVVALYAKADVECS